MKPLKHWKTLFESHLEAFTQTLKSPAPLLTQAMNYSLLAGGKRIRPLLVYGACEAVHGNLESAHSVALAIEMVHTFSLIHDDLPAMDNDDYRRGKLTNHKVFGEDIAILAGDALLSEAFTLLSHLTLPPAITLLMIQTMGDAIGAQGMVAGQTIDCKSPHTPMTLEQLQSMHALKTGRLIMASLELGALCNPDLSPTQLSGFKQFGHHLGIAFQIQDDLLDITGDLKTLGKHPHQDEKLGKSTYPSLLGFQGAQEALSHETQAAQACLARIAATGLHTTLLEAVYDFVMVREQ